MNCFYFSPLFTMHKWMNTRNCTLHTSPHPHHHPHPHPHIGFKASWRQGCIKTTYCNKFLPRWNLSTIFVNLGVHEWDWVHERLFMPEGAARGHKKRSCTQSHSWTPFIHQLMMDHPSYAIILQIHTFNLPKIHEKPPFILPLSTFKSSRKIGDLHGVYHSKQGCGLCVYIRLGA